jgi:hypothetical protein
MQPTHFFKTKCFLLILCSFFGTVVAAGGTEPETAWKLFLFISGCAFNAGTALKAYLSDASSRPKE